MRVRIALLSDTFVRETPVGQSGIRDALSIIGEDVARQKSLDESSRDSLAVRLILQE